MIFKQFNEPQLRNTDTVEFQLWTKFGISEISYLIQAENFNALSIAMNWANKVLISSIYIYNIYRYIFYRIL